MRRTKLTLLLLVSSLAPAFITARAQSPAPIVVQAASPTTATSTTITTTSTAVAKDVESVQAAIKTLQQMKAANDEILSKQKAALERLDEMQQAADQLKIFTKRG